ncbi:hypothetical protein HDU99_006908 [Rhizoclosmatium hyalinum]|nr:hypothetical protein HDU99_006908 [Rhizoclosmatium hyalinum]
MLTSLVLLASLALVKADATIVGSDAPSQLLTLYSQFPKCAKQCVSSQFQVTVGSANLKAGVLTLDDVIYFCQDPNTQKGLTDCINKACPANDPSLTNRWVRN